MARKPIAHEPMNPLDQPEEQTHPSDTVEERRPEKQAQPSTANTTSEAQNPAQPVIDEVRKLPF